MKIVLLGYMGSGKSTIGQALSQALNLPFKDLDQEIEAHLGATVAEIFEQKGELFFRKKETEVLQTLIDSNEQFVLSLGGGTPCYGMNMKLLEEASDVKSIYLKASVAELTARLKMQQQQRPLLAGRSDADLTEFIGKHLFERMAFYERANQIIGVSEKSISELVEEIRQLL